jgi:hypothetical protein
MITSQEEKNYLTVYTRVLIDFFNPPTWGTWHPAYPRKNYYYGPRERYRDLESAMSAAQRRLHRKETTQSPHRVVEYKIVKTSEIKTYEDV